jgi:hypothetical protein
MADIPLDRLLLTPTPSVQPAGETEELCGETTMLKITTRTDAGTVILKLEGRLAGPWVEELNRCWREAADSRRSSVLVDLTGVTFIAPEGKALLARMWRQGAKFHAMGCLNTCIVEGITRSRIKKAR